MASTAAGGGMYSLALVRRSLSADQFQPHSQKLLANVLAVFCTFEAKNLHAHLRKPVLILSWTNINKKNWYCDELDQQYNAANAIGFDGRNESELDRTRV